MLNDDVKFDIDTQPQTVVQAKTSKFIQFVMNHSFGMVKDETQASYVLLVFVVIAFLVSFMLLSGGSENLPQTYVVPAI